ncbi:CoA transferase subunit A [Peribacillus sp. SCS-37]|uniref:CoA transferase subunit A n=1 Tax=Paraperibacillus esterisolvens TaxID=3115296 RepID=UPI0039061B5F
MKKLVSPEKAISRIRDGSRIMVGGFGLVGCPLTLIDFLVSSGVKDLEIISNNLGEPGRGLGLLVRENRIRKGIGSFFTSNPEVAEAKAAGRLEIELVPQGTLSEAIRAGGAGIPAFFTPVGAGTDIAAGKEERKFGSTTCILQESFRADVALVKAHRADTLGNLIYSKSARNFNPIMATAAELVIAEVDEIVEAGILPPDDIVTPHLFVDLMVLREGEGL